MTSTWILTDSLPVSTDTYYQQVWDALQFVQDVTSYLCFIVNLIKTAVFAQKCMRKASSGKFMLALSSSHFTWLLFRVLHSIAKRAITDPEKVYAYDMFVLYVGISVGNVLYRSCLFIACLMSSERLYAVSRPLHIKQFILARRPLLFVFAIFLLTACYHMYVPLQYTFYMVSGINGTKIVVFGYTDWYFGNRNIVNGFSAAGKIIFIFVPLVWISAFNALVVYFLRRHSDDYKTVQRTADEEAISRHDRQMTLTILACTAGYVIFILPATLHFLALTVVPEYNYTGRLENMVRLMEEVQDFCLQLSFMSDFLSFLLLSKAFRDCLMHLLMCRNFRADVRNKRI
ncbi:hypothetical protein C0Q70_07452 [Pomacea canaliculata]|uniref:G-protein coupled receptors family 1 profile domain-containing protein n=1 Tax=Pomacea canaliculata TaxID=400727 RepID=A0A2T7PF30_POMCA|nr:hypothetical protein C0Q70_07452 [Pomacea canaliculata]